MKAILEVISGSHAGRRFEFAGHDTFLVGRGADAHLSLADDPHLAIQMPSIWHQIGLHCRTVGPSCPYDVVGVSFAGVPGVVIGHNQRIAWGVTNLGPDVQDLFIEKPNPANPDRRDNQCGGRSVGDIAGARHAAWADHERCE